MLKKRIAATLIVRDGIVVQSIGFKKYLPVGRPEIAVEFLNNWGIDEIILTDISASRQGRGPDVELLRRVAPRCFVPLTVGGGISSLEQVHTLIHNGADKVSLNHIVQSKPELVTEIAHTYGDQCVIVAADWLRLEDGSYARYDHVSKTATPADVAGWARQMAALGAGELLVQAVHRDGSYTGFDTELVAMAAGAVQIPVIALGGAGNAGHFRTLFEQSDAAAGSAGNYFHFSEHSVIATKQQLLREIQNLRLETHASYDDSAFDERLRLLKKPDEVLEAMLFTKIEKEVI